MGEAIAAPPRRDWSLDVVAVAAAVLVTRRRRALPGRFVQVRSGFLADPSGSTRRRRRARALARDAPQREARPRSRGKGLLRAREETRDWRFEVADEGGGITLDPPELVQPFSRGKTQHSGGGLGLAIVRTIAEAHGGAAGVENRSGEGATLWIRVPK